MTYPLDTSTNNGFLLKALNKGKFLLIISKCWDSNPGILNINSQTHLTITPMSHHNFKSHE